MLPMAELKHAIADVPARLATGRVSRIAGLIAEGTLPNARLGMLAELEAPGGARVPAEVVAVTPRGVALMPLGGVGGITAGSRIIAAHSAPTVRTGNGLLGRVVDAWCQPIDGRGAISLTELPWRSPLDPAPLNPLERGLVDTVLPIGVRVLDGLLTIGAGQRMAILAGAGVGKSTLLAMMVKQSAADVVVVGLIGERGREVKEFVERDLGAEGMTRAVVVAATSDQPGALRIRAAKVATAIAEAFRDQGKRVLLLLDSLSRVAMAQRELGLAVGEPPATKGYPPSAFAIIPRLLERAGPGLASTGGSITAFYTALLEGDDLGDPVGDAVKATTDGHIVLSRSLADRGHFPAVDVLKSVSRVMSGIVDPKHRASAQTLRALMADHREVEELATIGAYQRGAVPRFDRALAHWPRVEGWLRQSDAHGAPPTFTDSLRTLHLMAQEVSQ